MISYPGEILGRFGRYEAIEDLGRADRGHLWKAWDPFLERFVTVVALPGINPAELYKEITDLDKALHRWLPGWYREGRRVLDFGPGSRLAPAYLVFDLVDKEPRAAAKNSEKKREPVVVAPTSAAPLASRGWLTALASVVALVVGLIAGATFMPNNNGTRQPVAAVPPLPPTATIGVALSTPTPTSHATTMATMAIQPTKTAPPIPTRTVAKAVTPVPSPSPSPSPAVAVPLAVRVKPEPGVISLLTGARSEFVAEVGNRKAKAFRWEIAGKTVGTEPRYRFASAFLDDASRRDLVLTVTDSDAGESVQRRWTLDVDARNTEPKATIRLPRKSVVPGAVVDISADIVDQDIERGDKITCTWRIDQVDSGTACNHLEWRVPAGRGEGAAVISLIARDARGATATDEKSLTIQAAPEPTALSPTAPAARQPTIEAERVPEAAATAVQEVAAPATATVGISAAEEEQAIRAALAAFADHYQATLREKTGQPQATARFQVLSVDRKGDAATAVVERVAEIPGQDAQSAQKVYQLKKTNGTWSVLE